MSNAGKPVAPPLVSVEQQDERARRRAAIEEIIRWRIGKDLGARPGCTIPELIEAGRRYS